MINIVRNSQRQCDRQNRHEVRHTFSRENGVSPDSLKLGSLAAFDELWIHADAGTAPHCEDDMEVVTYVYKGALSQKDNVGHSWVMNTGEFQRLTTGRGIRYRETSVSRTDGVHLFRILLRPNQAGLDQAFEQKRFTEAERRNMLCVVVAPDGRKGALRIHQNVLVWSAIFDPGHHMVYEMKVDGAAWFHILCGEVHLNEYVLTDGDGVGVTGERSISLTVHEKTEILLVDLAAASGDLERR